eukprot:5089450-Amphidinium_carterae.1
MRAVRASKFIGRLWGFGVSHTYLAPIFHRLGLSVQGFEGFSSCHGASPNAYISLTIRVSNTLASRCSNAFPRRPVNH